MDGRQKPDAQSENANDLNDDEIIDLTRVVEEENTDEIIDLTNVLDQPENEPEALNETAGSLPDTDEDIVELVEPASSADTVEDTASMLDKENDDEIIDLTEMEKTLDADLSESAPEDDEEDVIDLLESVEPDALAAEADDTDEIAEFEPPAETMAGASLETTEAPDDGLTAAEEQAVTIPDEKADDDDIIDLTEMETALDADLVDNGVETVEDDEDEEIIDLLDPVDPESRDDVMDEPTDRVPVSEGGMTGTIDAADKTDIDLAQESVPTAETDQDLTFPEEKALDEDIIDLTEMETALDTDLLDNAIEDDKEEEEIIDLFDAVEPKSPISGEGPAPTSPDGLSAAAASFTEEQLEAALERTIHKIYAEKIEQLLIKTIEKTVNQEIAKIKQALMENDDDVSD